MIGLERVFRLITFVCFLELQIFEKMKTEQERLKVPAYHDIIEPGNKSQQHNISTQIRSDSSRLDTNL